MFIISVRHLLQFCFYRIKQKAFKVSIFDLFTSVIHHHWIDHIIKIVKIIYLKFSDINLNCMINVCINFNRAHLNDFDNVEKCVILQVSSGNIV